MNEIIENKTFAEIQIGDQANLTRTLDQDGVEALASLTGNFNLIDLDPGPANTAMFSQGGGQVGWAAALFASLADTRLPGLGSVAQGIEVRFHRPVAIGAAVTATATVKEKRPDRGTVLLECRAVDSSAALLAEGWIDVLAPKEKRRYTAKEMPTIQLRHADRFEGLLQTCAGLPPLACAIAHPCSADALRGAIEAAQHGLIDPILIGPEEKIRAIADQENLDISPYRLVPADHSHHAAALAVAMVQSGEAQALMKGSLHTDEVLAEVVKKEGGLRTERRISHCFLLSVPTFTRWIIITDAAINIAPNLEDKRDIIQNAIDLAHAIGLTEPKVAILSAVETVTNKIPSTLEAGALCKMADRRQITGGLVDGPLAFDNAIDEQAAKTKGIQSPVAGKADILVVPNLEAGNMLAKQLTFMADAEAAGLVIGARVPIILTSRADSARARLASCAVAVLFAEAQRQGSVLQKAPG
ncbi:putative Phosphate acetyl/butyryltransferase [Candidatus Competibacter denitrificans Run_A_D11]|uniref:Phosphate acetyl/butyryltransferase n=1 Tax=Candidatus Competibacter denitrificans Run_A_D11 TaxID=1400863 RepID=W6M3X7_9GAMM|nr:bifunctional enoyl-CoA hydratase/phosphate acetyltransferase [Candidatus Competibacter denitrificans]CDI01209.1 putative Phosphate acetyl/butyryltransferase [Candidatus Competibacter denitrificans Run_A_D11]HRC70583.1 bifunctional enoyl-CoA hydratase/phosphate acetyltransferase [Candidatus Competibacter denitrificans]